MPAGVKENKWFLVRRHVTANGADKFWDDCSAWTQHHRCKSHHLRDSLTEVHLLEDGSYGSRRRVEGKRVTVVMDPQPTGVMCVHRMYTKLARDSEYRRRVMYIDSIPLYMAEYLGQFPRAVVTW